MKPENTVNDAIPRRQFLQILCKGSVVLITTSSLYGCSGTSALIHSNVGLVRMVIRWPSGSGGRLIPASTQSIVVSVEQNGTQVVPQQIITPPSSGNTTTATFSNVPIGNVSVTAIAYPNSTATGTPVAQQTGSVAITADQVTPLNLVLESTVSSVTVSAALLSTTVGQVVSFTANAFDSAGETVLVAPKTWKWVSSNTAVATVQGSTSDNTAVVTSVGSGSAIISAAYIEPNPSVAGSQTITVQSAVNQKSITVAVNANQGPWDQSVNPGYPYGVNDQQPPVAVSASNGISFAQGGVITIKYLSGTVTYFHQLPAPPSFDANGDSKNPTNDILYNGYHFPSYYVNPTSYPVNSIELLGTFANAQGEIVGTPFAVGNGPTSVTVPNGAVQLLLGANDGEYWDNGGAWQIQVSGPTS